MALSGMASSIGMGLAVYLDDHFTNTANTLKSTMSSLGVEAQQLEKNFRDLDNFGAGIDQVGQKILGFAMEGLDAYKSYENTMNSVKVIGQFARETATQDLKLLNDLNQSLAQRYATMPDAIATAQLELSKSGKKVDEIANMTEAVLALGAATETAVDGVNGTSEILVNIMQAFGAASTEAHRYAAVITSAANQSTIDVKDFFHSMRYAGDVSKGMGVELEEVAAVIATLGNAGLKGSIAGTSFANMLRYLSTGVNEFATEKQVRALELMGLGREDFVEANGNLKNMTTIIQTLREGLVKLDQQQRFTASQGLFGVRGARGGSPLLTSVLEGVEGQWSYEDNLAKIIADRDVDGVGAHIQQATDMLNDLQGDHDKLRVAWHQAMMKMGESLAPLARNLYQRLTWAANAAAKVFESPFMQKLFALGTSGGVLMVIAGKILQGVARFGLFLINFTRNFQQMLVTFTTTTKAHNAGLKSSGNMMVAAARQMLLAAEKNILAAKGLTMHSLRSGTSVITANPRTGGGRFRSNWFTRLAAMLGGRKALRWASTVVGKFSGIFSAIGKFGGWLKIAGGLLGRVVGALFSWPVMLTDIALQLVTGKGLFGWTWELIKGLNIGITDFTSAMAAVGKALNKLFDYLMNTVTLGFWGSSTGKGWFGELRQDLSKGIDYLFDNKKINPNSEEAQWWERAQQRKLDQARAPYEPKSPVLHFRDGKLVDSATANEQFRSQIKPAEQHSPRSLVTSHNTSKTVVEKRPINLALTLHAPESGTMRRNIKLEEDQALLGSAIL